MVSSIGSSSASSALAQMMQNRLQEMFKKTDADGDGQLTLSEFKAGAPQGGAAPQGAPALDDVFASADTDGDGSLSQSEFEAGMPKGPPPGGMISGGNNLLLSSDEEDEDLVSSILNALLDAATESSESSATTETAAAADVSSENSTEEKLFNYLDQNDDGLVSEEEMKTGFEQLRNEMMSYLLSTQSSQAASAA